LKNYYYLFLLLFLVISCENDEVPEPERQIPALVRPYLEQFLLEANQRGVYPDTSKLTFTFEKDIKLGDAQKNVIGLCTRTNNLHEVKLDTLNALWLLSGYLGREEIVFHELGHCLLGRTHRDDTFKSGDFASIMRSIGLLQYGSTDRFQTIFSPPTERRAHRREYYLEELFDEQTDLPCWSDSTQLPLYPLTYFDQELIFNHNFRDSGTDQEGNLWLFAEEATYRFVNESFVSVFPGYHMLDMTTTTDGQLWISAEYEGQQVIAELVSGEIKTRFNQGEMPDQMTAITQLLVDRSDRIWIGDREGTIAVNSGSGFQTLEVTGSGAISNLSEGSDDTIYFLKNGAFYVATDVTSAIRYDRQNSELSSSSFSDLEVDNQGIVWLRPSGSNRYLLRFHRDQTVTRIDLNNSNLIGIRVNDVSSDPQGTIWIATTNGIRKWEGTAFSSYCSYNTGMKPLDFKAIKPANNGKLWTEAIDPGNLQRILVLSETAN